MEVLKITAEGLTTSFRYPHFMLGIQPTYQMPPPATIYGHICSAMGEWVCADGLMFAYHFTYQAQFDDVEHVHVLEASDAARGKLPGTDWHKAMEGNINPFKRAVLYRPRLVLYLNRPEWLDAFRSPRYAVALGRSQDLCMYSDVRVISLTRANAAYFEHTLAPYDFTMRSPRGLAVLMPRWLDYRRRRQPVFDRYVMLRQRVHTMAGDDYTRLGAEQYWTDPDTPADRGAHLGLLFHSFSGDNNAAVLSRLA